MYLVQIEMTKRSDGKKKHWTVEVRDQYLQIDDPSEKTKIIKAEAIRMAQESYGQSCERFRVTSCQKDH